MSWVFLAYAEDFDNVGLLLGDKNQEVNGVLVCHDALEGVIDEAISLNCNLVICFLNYRFHKQLLHTHDWQIMPIEQIFANVSRK